LAALSRLKVAAALRSNPLFTLLLLALPLWWLLSLALQILRRPWPTCSPILTRIVRWGALLLILANWLYLLLMDR